MQDKKNVYFMDLPGYDFQCFLVYLNKLLYNLRKYIQENAESFYIVFMLQLPDNLPLGFIKKYSDENSFNSA